MFPLSKPLGGTNFWNTKLLLVPVWSIFPIHMTYKNPLGMHTVPPANLFTVHNRERRFYLGANLTHLDVAFPSNKWHRILSVSSGKLRERRLSSQVKGNEAGVMVTELLFLFDGITQSLKEGNQVLRWTQPILQLKCGVKLSLHFFFSPLPLVFHLFMARPQLSKFF